MAHNQETINTISLDFNLRNIDFVKSGLNKLPHVKQMLSFIETLLTLRFKTLTETCTEKVIEIIFVLIVKKDVIVRLNICFYLFKQ